jgi:macrolide transport system ATP-binding/permease protein
MRASVPTAGNFFTDDDLLQRNKVAVLGMTNVRKLFGKTDPIGAIIKINKINFQVVGVLPEKRASTFWDPDDVILVPVTTAMYRVLGDKHVGAIDVEVSDKDHIPEAKEAVNNLLLQRHHIPPTQDTAFKITDMAMYQDAMSKANTVLTLLVFSVAVISLIVGGIGIMNIMLVSVTERTREIGLRLAIGAKTRDILSQFLVEAVTLSILGGIVGILSGVGASLLISHFAGWNTLVSATAIVLAFAFSGLVGVFFGYYPARKAAMLDPIDALRYE